jgi:branched-chain amino acid transport system permease protein
MILDIIIVGLISGSTYAILAIGFSLIFGVARIVNIAHTAFYMVASYIIYLGMYQLGLHPGLAILSSVVATAILGLVSYKFLIDPIREHEAAVLIATIALAMIMQEVMHLVFGDEYLSVPPLIAGYVIIFNVKVMYQHIFTIMGAVVVLGVTWFFLMKTKLGLEIRAMAQDREVANLMGMNEIKVAMLTMGISVALAAFAGAVVVPLTVLNPTMWMTPLIMMMAVVVLGGMGSLKGSFAGAYILGFTEALVVFLVPMGAFLKASVALSIMILVLVIRPEGLFGISFEEER